MHFTFKGLRSRKKLNLLHLLHMQFFEYSIFIQPATVMDNSILLWILLLLFCHFVTVYCSKHLYTDISPHFGQENWTNKYRDNRYNHIGG